MTMKALKLSEEKKKITKEEEQMNHQVFGNLQVEDNSNKRANYRDNGYKKGGYQKKGKKEDNFKFNPDEFPEL